MLVCYYRRQRGPDYDFSGRGRFYAAGGLLNLRGTLPEALASRDSGPLCPVLWNSVLCPYLPGLH